MSKRGRRPKVGDRITHVLPHLDVEREGVVEQLLSAQFTYITDSGVWGSCLYTGLWEVKE